MRYDCDKQFKVGIRANELVPSTASYLDTVQRGHPCGIIVNNNYTY